MVAVLHRDDAERCGWALIGKLAFHTKPICDVLYITQPNPIHKSTPKLLPRLISLATDRVSLKWKWKFSHAAATTFFCCQQDEKPSHPDWSRKCDFLLHFYLQHIVEYDLLESVRGTLGLVTSFTKRIFQSVFPVSMTLIFNRRLGEHQILIADNEMKFRIFDRNTFEILATFLGPIYDTHVRQLVSFGLVIASRLFGLEFVQFWIFMGSCRANLSSTKTFNIIFHPYFPFFPRPLSHCSTQVSILTDSHQNSSSSRQTKTFASTHCHSMAIHFEVWASSGTQRESESSGSTSGSGVSSPLDTKAIPSPHGG